MLNLTLQTELFLNCCKNRKALNDKTIKATEPILGNSLNLRTIRSLKNQSTCILICCMNSLSQKR